MLIEIFFIDVYDKWSLADCRYRAKGPKNESSFENYFPRCMASAKIYADATA